MKTLKRTESSDYKPAKSLFMTHFMHLGHIYTQQWLSCPSQKPPLTHLQAQQGLVFLEIHLFLDLQEVHEVQEILVAQFLGRQMDHYGLFHQEVLVNPFHQESPVLYHPKMKAQFRDLSGESSNNRKEITSVNNNLLVCFYC